MVSFLEIRLPIDIERDAKGGPRYNTRITPLLSGREVRNPEWSKPRGVWDVGYGITNGDILFSLIEFFHVVGGATFGFRFKEWSDFTITDSLIGLGNGSTDQFQILQTYNFGAFNRTRPIYKIVAGTVVLRVNSVLQADPGDYTFDEDTGIITFTTIPPSSDPINVDCEFDVPVRFGVDDLDIVNHAFDVTNLMAGSFQIPIIELRVDGALI